MKDNLVLVIGATGAQGGSVARYLLRRGKFAVRALTRNPESAKARELRALGAEVVRGELDDRASLRSALRGAYGVFGVTSFWEHFEKELDHGRNLINAIAGAEVEHFVFSSLPSVRITSRGELKCPHFDQKHELETYGRVLGIPATFVHVAFYYENFLSSFPPRADGDGGYRFGFPQREVPLAGVSAEDIGGVVAPIFERPADFLGRTVGVAGDDLLPRDYAAALTRALGKPVQFHYVPREVFAAFPFHGAADLADMFEFNSRYIPSRRADVDESRALHPAMQTFEQWAAKNRSALERVLGG